LLAIFASTAAGRKVQARHRAADIWTNRCGVLTLSGERPMLAGGFFGAQ
jgi:hypothetical protein